MITNLSTAGLKASLAGTSLNTAFLNLASSSKELNEVLGITLEEADFETPLLALTKIEKALQQFGKLERVGIIQRLVNIRGGRAIFGEFLSGLGKLEDVTEQIKMSADEARIASQKLDSRLGGVGRRALSAFQELQLSIGQTTEGPLTVLGEGLAGLLNNLSDLAKENPRVVQTLLAMGPASLIAGAGILTLSSFLSKLVILAGPLMVLNTAIFKTLATVVGAQVKFGRAIFDSLTVPYIAAQKKIAETQAKSLKAYETYQAKLLAYDTKRAKELDKIQTRLDTYQPGSARYKTAQVKQAAVLAGGPGQGAELQRAMDAVNSARVKQSSEFWTKQINLGGILSKLIDKLNFDLAKFLKMMDKFQGSPFKLQPDTWAYPYKNNGGLGMPGFAGKGLGYNPNVWAPTAAQNIPDAPLPPGRTRGLNRSGGLSLRQMRDLPEQEVKEIFRTLLLGYRKWLQKPLTGNPTKYTAEALEQFLSTLGRVVEDVAKFDVFNLDIDRGVGPTKSPGQLPLPLQFELDFGGKGKSDFLKSAAPVKDAAGKFIGKGVYNELVRIVKEFSKLKLFEGMGLSSIIDEAFTAFNLSESAKATFKYNILRALSQSIKDQQLFLPLSTSIAKAIEEGVEKQLEFNFEDAPFVRKGALALRQGRLLPDAASLPEAQRQRLLGVSPGEAKTTNRASQKLLGGPRNNQLGFIVEGKVIGRNAEALSKWGKAGLRVRTIAISLAASLNKLVKSFALMSGMGAVKGLGALPNMLAGISAGFRAISKAAVGYNYAKGFIDLTKSVLKLTWGFAKLLNNIRRFAFSLSGFLLVFDVILLFGDKIPGIAQGLEVLGDAFNTLFHYIGKTAQATIPSFQKIGGALKTMFTGDAMGGLEQLKAGFSELGTTISGGLTAAWNNFVMVLSPVTEIVKQIGKSLYAGFQLAIDLVSSVFGTLKDGISITIGSEGSFLETLAQAFSAENISNFFAMIGGALVSVVQLLMTGISKIFEVIQIAKQGLLAIYQAISTSMFASDEAQASAKAGINLLDPTLEKRRKEAEDKVIGLRNNMQLDQQTVRQGSKFDPGVQEAIARLRNYPQAIADAEAELANIGPKIGSLAFMLDGRIKDTESALNRFINALREGANRMLPKAQAQVNNDLATDPSALTSGNDGLDEFRGDKGGTMTDFGMYEDRVPTKADIEAANQRYYATEPGSEEEQKAIDEAHAVRRAFDSNEAIPMPAKMGIEGLMTDFSNAIEDVTPDLEAQRQELLKEAQEGLKQGVAPQTEQVKSLATAVDKAISGDFMSTRNNLLRGVPKAEKLAEQTAKATQQTADNTQKILDRQPVFGG